MKRRSPRPYLAALLLAGAGLLSPVSLPQALAADAPAAAEAPASGSANPEAARPAAPKPAAKKAEAKKAETKKAATKQQTGKTQAGKTQAAKKEPASKSSAAGPVANVAKPVPEACARMIGVERTICVECDGVAFLKRFGCQQRVFWSNCKGMRLLEDSYCQMHENRGPPGE